MGLTTRVCSESFWLISSTWWGFFFLASFIYIGASQRCWLTLSHGLTNESRDTKAWRINFCLEASSSPYSSFGHINVTNAFELLLSITLSFPNLGKRGIHFVSSKLYLRH
jgi:hypothetical protein